LSLRCVSTTFPSTLQIIGILCLTLPAEEAQAWTRTVKEMQTHSVKEQEEEQRVRNGEEEGFGEVEEGARGSNEEWRLILLIYSFDPPLHTLRYIASDFLSFRRLLPGPIDCDCLLFLNFFFSLPCASLTDVLYSLFCSLQFCCDTIMVVVGFMNSNRLFLLGFAADIVSFLFLPFHFLYSFPFSFFLERSCLSQTG
jgi:hypothetical protein